MNTKYLSLKSSKTTKIGLRTEGYIHYRVLSDQDNRLYFNITGNDDDGYYSKEIIPFDSVEQIVKTINPMSLSLHHCSGQLSSVSQTIMRLF